jgi:hypothetical protein
MGLPFGQRAERLEEEVDADTERLPARYSKIQKAKFKRQSSKFKSEPL